MATTVDELIVEIKADTKNVTRGLDGLKKQINQTDRSSQVLTRSMRLLGRAIAAVGVAQVVRNIASIGDSFEQLRISLSTMFGGTAQGEKALQRINTFAQTTPFQLEDVTKAFISLKAQGIEPSEKVLAAFGDAASATLTPLESFNSLVRMLGRSTQGALGLEDLNQLADRGIPVFKILEERIGKTRDEVTEFGKSAAGAAKIMEELTEGLEEGFGGLMAAQMDTFGVKLSNLVINFKRLADEIFRAGGGGVLKDFTDLFAEFVGTQAEAMRVFREGQDVPSPILELIGVGETAAARVLIDKEIDQVIDTIHKLDDVRRMLEDNANKVGGGIVGDLIIGAGNLQAMLLPEGMELPSLDATMAQMRGAMQFLERLRNARKELGQTTVEISRAADADAISALQAMQGVLEDSITPLEKVNELFKQFDLIISTGTMGDLSVVELSRIKDELNAMKLEAEETSETFKEVMAPAIAQATNAFTNDFVRSLMEGESALASFRDFAKDIVNQIISTFLQMTVVNTILNSIFGLTGTPNAFPTLANRGKAGGGNVSRGQPYLVGERGPELFMPNTGGRVMNNADTRSAFGGGGEVVVNQTINLSAGVVGTVRTEVQRMLPEIANVTKLGVLEATRRGGAYRKGLLGS